MNVWQAIKSEKQLSLNHWRYKLLHWSFCQKNITKKEDSFLPGWLYTHYCPLFHLTNVLVLLAPLTLFFKAMYWPLYFMTILVLGIIRGIGDVMRKRAELRYDPKEEEAGWIRGYVYRGETWAAFLEKFAHKLKHHEEGEAFDVFTRAEAYVAKMKKKEADKAAARERRKKQLEAWLLWVTNTSRVVIKSSLTGLFWLCVLALIAVIGWLAIPMGKGVISIASWIVANFLNILMWCGIALLSVVCLAVVIACLALMQHFIKSKFGERAARVLSTDVGFIFTPFGWPFLALYYVIGAFFNFVSVFYEESCPPIKIKEFEESSEKSVDKVA